MAGLGAAPILWYLVGWMLFGHRSGWDVGQGEGFRVFLVSLYGAPLGGVYGAVAGAFLRQPRAGARFAWLALLGYALLGLLLHLAADGA